MNSMEAVVRTIGLDSSGRRTAQIEVSAGPKLQPGQVLLAYPLQAPWSPLRYTLYPSEISAARFRVRLPRDQRWEPGDRLDLWGPMGSGFSPPDRARRWLLTAVECPIEMLLPLLDRGRARGSSIAVLGQPTADRLPPEVEILQDAADGLAWADYIALAASRNSLSAVRPALGLEPGFQPGCPAEILILDEFPCGIGACGTCPINTNSGWGLACVDGPVFSLDDLTI